MRAGLIAAWLAGPALALAHPHGSLDCDARLGVSSQPGSPPRLAWLDLQLTLDAASSQSLLPRIRLDDAAASAAATPESPQARQARLFTQMVAGLFRQSGWMLQLKLPGQAAAAPPLQDPEPARFQLAADGRLQVSVRLQPAADDPALPLAGLQLSCQDPVWYWLTGFQRAAQVQLEPAVPGCQAQLGELQREADQAQALQAAALRAGSPGADRMADSLASAEGRRTATATLHCAAP